MTMSCILEAETHVISSPVDASVCISAAWYFQKRGPSETTQSSSYSSIGMREKGSLNGLQATSSHTFLLGKSSPP